MLLACHKKSYLICVEFSKYYVIFIYFQAAVSALLAVSVLYVEKNQNKILRNISKFLTSRFRQIAFLMTCHTLFENDSITDINYPELFSLFHIDT